MKKIILSALAVCAFTFASAQDKSGAGLASGNIVLAGDVSFNSSATADAKSSNFMLSPGLGYMMSENLMLLGQVAISSGTTNAGTPGAVDSKTSGLGLNAGVRYFFTPADKFSLSLGGGLGYNSSKVDEAKTNTLALTVPVGLHYFMNNNFAINATWGGLGYSSSKMDGGEATNTISLGLNMSAVSFGLLYKL